MTGFHMKSNNGLKLVNFKKKLIFNLTENRPFQTLNELRDLVFIIDCFCFVSFFVLGEGNLEGNIPLLATNRNTNNAVSTYTHYFFTIYFVLCFSFRSQ